jgi:hypothetical protein
MSEFMVYVTFTDGDTQAVPGEPSVADGVLYVRTKREDGTDYLRTEQGFPLGHVRQWSVDYDEVTDA